MNTKTKSAAKTDKPDKHHEILIMRELAVERAENS